VGPAGVLGLLLRPAAGAQAFATTPAALDALMALAGEEYRRDFYAVLTGFRRYSPAELSVLWVERDRYRPPWPRRRLDARMPLLAAAQASSGWGRPQGSGPCPLRGSLTPPRLEVASCARSAMATLSASAHVHAARRLHFSASSDGLLQWLCEECSGRGLLRLGELLDDLLIERQAEQPEPPHDPELEALLPF